MNGEDLRCFLYPFKLILSKKLTLKGAFRHFKEIKIISRKPAANAAYQKIDNSRLSTDIITPLFQHRMIDSTFISGIEVDRVNLLGTGFNQMKTLLLICLTVSSKYEPLHLLLLSKSINVFQDINRGGVL